MTTKSDLPGFHDSDLILMPYNIVPNISDDIQQVIGYMMGRSTGESKWKMVQTDALGRLLISTGGVSTESVNQFAFNVAVGEELLLPPNPARTQVIIQNNTDNTCLIGLILGATMVSGQYLNPGAIFSSDNWVGPIYVQNKIGIPPYEIRVMEF